MRVLWKLCLAFVLLFSLSFHLHAQETPQKTEDLLPDYKVEKLSDTESMDRLFLPFIFNGYLYSFSFDQKLPVWRIFIGGDLVNPFIIRDDFIYLYDIYNRVYAIDIRSGETLWKMNVSNEIKGRLLVYEKFVLVSSLNGIVYVLNSENGAIEYAYRGDRDINANLNLYKNLLIVPYKNGKIIAYDIKTRDIDWVFNSEGIINASPIVKDGNLFFGDWNDTFYALDAYTGEPLWSSYVGENITRDFIVFDSEIILFFAKGEILCLDTKDGEIKWVKYFKGTEFSYNYFAGMDKFYIFIPEFVAMDPHAGNIVFRYRERAYNLYKEMLFQNMVEGKRSLNEADKHRILDQVYYSVSEYPRLPPVVLGESLAYFVTDDSYFYVYDLKKDFFILRYKID